MNILRTFLKHEASSGILLLVMALVALVLDNSVFSDSYQKILQTPSTLFWINEGLMTLFFLSIGLELKREFLQGELSTSSKVVLPSIAALGGMLAPALIYLAINFHHAPALKGWAVPVATDIAFALGVLSLFGKQVPLGLKVFLMTLAIFDDVGAIIIIAGFYSHDLSYFLLGIALLLILILQWLNIAGVQRLLPYFLVGFILWLCVVGSGVHATVAGILLAFTIPLAPLQYLEKKLHPWVAYLIMPLFALANAGVSFQGLHLSIITDFVSLGIILGLFLGKQLGVFGFVWTVVKLNWCRLPKHTTWLELYGIALLCGIGFTMSLFLGTLAFANDNPIYLTEVRLGVLIGSLLSGLMGAGILYIAFSKKDKGRLQS